MKLHIGDHVVIITGKDKGKTGSVLRVLPTKNRLVIAGINMRTRHVKATPQQPGQRVQYEASIHVSNVMLIDPKTKKRTRIGSKTDEKGKKHRIARGSGEILPVTKAGATNLKKETKAKTDETKTTKAAKTKEKDGLEVTKVDAPPDRKPFWKKMVDFGADASPAGDPDSNAPVSPRDHSIPDTNPTHQTRSSARSK